MGRPLRTLSLSAETLASIAFHGRVEHVSEGAFDQLLSMRLPRLTSIDLGCLVSELPDTNSKVTQFLHRHPLLERLSLGYEDLRPAGSNAAYHIQLPVDESTRRNFLPHLRHLACFPPALAFLITQRAPFLSQLTSLSLASTRIGFDDITLLQEAYTAHPDISAHLASVCYLRFQFPIKHRDEFRVNPDDGTAEERELWTDLQNYSSQRQLRLMNWAAHYFPHMTSWEGDLPPMQGVRICFPSNRRNYLTNLLVYSIDRAF